MYRINDKKFQNTPRGDDGIAAVAAKRIRFEAPTISFKSKSGVPRIKVLHPTKGYRDMSLGRSARRF